MLRGPRDPQSYRASLLRGGGREQQDQSFAFNPPSRNLRAAVAGEGKKLTAAGLGLVQRTPRPEGERWEMQRNTVPRGTALPCPACRPSLRARGLRPTAANGQPTLLLTPNVLGSADSKSRANFCTPERLGSFSAAETPCPRFRSSGWSVRPCHASKARVPPSPVHQRADRGGQPAAGLWARGAETHARPQPSWRLGPNAAKRRAAVRLGPCFSQRGAQLTRGRERSAGAPLCIYSGILSTAGSV